MFSKTNTLPLFKIDPIVKTNLCLLLRYPKKHLKGLIMNTLAISQSYKLCIFSNLFEMDLAV